jgi:hypothetical protein
MGMHRALVASLLLGASTAQAQTRDHPPQSMASSARMHHDQGESWTYVKPKVDLRVYRAILLEPTVVYDGADAQFNGISAPDRQKFASIVTQELRSEIAKSFPLESASAPGTARLRITLLGVDSTKGGLATATRVTPVGFALSAVKSLAHKPGSLTGSVLYAVELTDSRTGELQVAAVRRRTPDALDIGATLSTADTVKAVAQDIARSMREKLARAAGRP